ncbi:helix-turn-helix transcriptional regulator [Streptomyces sp. NPDC006355]|uniref:helix-turn-helix domain-containing protein n=1 Tax=Streptomyces sp. NPDC006355 TaxID=3156758 RepID=UPI0033BF1DDB
MAHNSTPLGDTVRAQRRAKGWSQERLATESGLSVSTVRNIEQRGHARLDTLSQVAAAFGVPTSALFAPGVPHPVGEDDSANRQLLASLRQALMPPVGIAGEALADPAEAAEPAVIRRQMEDALSLYNSDRYESVALMLPGLLRQADAAVVAAEDEERHREAALVRTHTLLLAGKYLTQVRQYDLAYQALTEGIRIARDLENTLTAATGVTGLCWLLLRQDRFDEAERLAATTAEAIEPKYSRASMGELAAYGELCLRIASAAIRNNREQEAEQARKWAATAASAMGHEHRDYRTHWARFGPATVEVKAVEDLALAGDAHGVINRKDQGLLSKNGLDTVGRPSAINWHRHRLDIAKAHVKLGSTHDAMEELARIKKRAPSWIQHQPMARYVMEDILKTRKRTLTREMRQLATFLNVQA